MKAKSVFLLLVFVFQMLPIKQAVKFCFPENILADELLHNTTEKSKDIFTAGEDDQFIGPACQVFPCYFFELPYIITTPFESSFCCHAPEIETPPPNVI